MREKYESNKYPGKYEGENVMVEVIVENDLFDATDGDVESPTGWFGRAGKWVIVENSQGFVFGYKHVNTKEADQEYASRESTYSNWNKEEDDG